MSLKLSLAEPRVRTSDDHLGPDAAPRTWHTDLLNRLSNWFEAEFHLLDGNTGDLLHCAFDHAARDWLARSELCRAVAARGKAELIEEVGPLAVLAIPVHRDSQSSVVAVATFVTSHKIVRSQLATAAEMLGLEPEDAQRWILRQTAWSPEMLLRMGQLATERLAVDWRLGVLDREVRDLTLNLASTYDEISLIYRLTQNLKLSSKDEELAALALEWLADVLPAESLAIQLMPLGADASSESRTEPLMLTYGPCPIGGDELMQIIDRLELTPGKRPLVVNHPETTDPCWSWPDVRQLVIVSLCEGPNCFGWLAAFNQSGEGEFGTVEASLLSSVAAIVGIHSGNAELYRQQRDLFTGMVRAMSSAIDAKDPYTSGHSDRVARIALRIAEELGCDDEQLETIYLAGQLHDVGKIGIDDEVLRKPGKLTEAEFDHIKTHAEIGHRILSDVRKLEDILPVVLHHHEQWNGKGYPHGLAGENIPLLARIVAVADSFDAMGSDRPYRPGMPEEKVDAILREGAGTQWDARVIEAFFSAREDIRAIAQKEDGPSLSLDFRDWT